MSKLPIIFKKFTRDEDGAIIILFAIILPVALAAIALGIDASLAFIVKSRAQSAADHSAIAASINGSLYGGSNAGALGEALQVANKNGFAAPNNIVTMNSPPTYNKSNYLSYSGAYEVNITSSVKYIFGSLFGISGNNISVRAVAIYDAVPCIVVLSPSESKALDAEGGGNITVGCSIYVNSNSSSAVLVAGGSKITAPLVSVVGNISGRSSVVSPSIETGAKSVPNPYASLSATPSGAIMRTSNFTASGGTTLNAGIYNGGFNVSTGTVTLGAGTFYINGNIEITGGSLVASQGTTIIMTGSTGLFRLLGGNINIVAPKTGPYAGIAIFSNVACNDTERTKCSGYQSSSSKASVTGTVVMPNQHFWIEGGALTTSICTSYVVKTFTVQGGGGIPRGCVSPLMDRSAYKGARLVE